MPLDTVFAILRYNVDGSALSIMLPGREGNMKVAAVPFLQYETVASSADAFCRVKLAPLRVVQPG